jgi:hypothetical protein
VCRWLAYSGAPISIEAILFEAKHSLIDQSLCSRSVETPTNGDGFGIGWYGTKSYPGLFHSIRPAWNDFNLRDLSAQVDSPLFLAHVRATSLATVQETNCHPFRYRNWLFVHNGEIFEVEKRMAGFVEATGREKGIAECLWMTVGVSDGKSIWAVRYASDGDAPTLYHSREMDEVYKLNPHLVGRLSPTTRIIVRQSVERFLSEPEDRALAG